jgi:hypothetical protein
VSGVAKSRVARNKAPGGEPLTSPARAPTSPVSSQLDQIGTSTACESRLPIMDEEVRLLQRYLGPQILALFA